MQNLQELFRHLFSRRILLILPGLFICIYALAVLFYVQSIPDLGVRTVFGTTLKEPIYFAPFNSTKHPLVGDEVVKIGDIPVQTWSDILNAPFNLRKSLSGASTLPSWAKAIPGKDSVVVQVEFQRGEEQFTYYCPLTTLPLEKLVPSVLWFFLKMVLFLVGALVLWKRPTDTAATQFFFLCVVTLGAYMGGYHWNHIANQPVFLLVFMICAVLLPVVSLHFYFVFPRKKPILLRHPVWTLGAIYGLPLLFLAVMVVLYLRLRWLVHIESPNPEAIRPALETLKQVIYVYLGIASLWYLACVISLVHSFRTVTEPTERNQVKWILLGALLALLPISYSLYLALWDPDAFGRGAATWPMFGASVCLTAAFAISITRYRLMELDKILSSSVGYFLISFLAGLVFYAVVFIGTLVFNQVIASPSLTEGLAVSTTALILMVVLDMARSRFKQALDRRFSRDKSQLDRTLHQLGQAVQQLVDPPALAQRLLYATTELMGVTRGSVFLRQGDPPLFRLVGSLGPTPSLTELSSGCPLIEASQEGNIVNLRLRSSNSQTPAQRQLQLIGGEIAHPLIHEGKLLALLVLGPKDTPFRSEDFNLLAAFTQITVLALESAEGHRIIEGLNKDLQAKVEKISEQQRRILALQTQLRRQTTITETITKEESLAKEGEATIAPPLPGGIVGTSPVLQQLLGMVRKVAPTDAVVLIHGESGTGKELLAQAVHETSNRTGKPFIKVHCAALSSNLLESELFGHVKGAFTSAHRDKIGRFEMANGGTLFLDEIGDISLDVQTKLLRVLQERTMEKVGSSEPVKVDVRIITATHQNLEKLIGQGKFREDLFYRLNVFPIQVPPLRDRPEDIPELALHFMRQSARRCHKEVHHIDDDVLVLLKGYSWPGNIRQLENVIERAVVICEGSTLSVHELPVELFHTLAVEEMPAAAQYTPSVRGFSPKSRVEREKLEREQLVRVLAASEGNKAEAARALGIARSTLVSRLKKLGLS
jgi:transcriptional regulator with GAF, ATPase, and Fis domain